MTKEQMPPPSHTETAPSPVIPDELRATAAAAIGPRALRAETLPSPEAVGQLEGLDLSAEDKVTVLLAALGQKPASEVTFSSSIWHSDEIPATVPEDKAEALTDVAHALGLRVGTVDRTDDILEVLRSRDPEGDFSNIEAKIGKGARQTHRFVCLAREETNLEELKGLLPHAADYDRQAMGRVFGYPETAVEAFEQGATPISARSLSGVDPATRAFAGFSLSPEHAHEELRTARHWAEAVKQASPAIYHEMLASEAA